MKVCEEWWPESNGFYIDGYLKAQLDLLARNVIKDWDFTVIISGGGETRVGKSLLAMQIGAYWTYLMLKLHNIKVPFSLERNFVFNWEDLIRKGNNLGRYFHYSTLIYDEAGESLEGVKALTSETKAVKDFLRECGQYNFLTILVIPEFFDLPKGIVVNRSKFLLDVSYKANDAGVFERGFFKFYSQRQKKRLYLRGKKELNYHAAPFNFQGRFMNFYTLDESEYRFHKQEALVKRELKKKNTFRVQRDALALLLQDKYELKSADISKEIMERYNVTFVRGSITMALRKFKDSLLEKKGLLEEKS